MRAFVVSLVLFVAVLFPKVSIAQVYPLRTAPAEVTAATAEWQINSEPIVVNSSVYLPTRAVRLFDGQVMTQVGVNQGVPVYADVTLEPNSIIYVPVGGDRMRTYERRRDRELAGTTGSRTPSFPVASPAATPAEERIVGTVGSIIPNAVGSPNVVTAPPRRTVVETIPRPRVNSGVWLDFNGSRWYSAGPSASYSPDRFTKAGEYRGFPVFRENGAQTDEIWVQVVTEGPLAPYSKR
jgi:hypothetical protein